MQKDKIIVGLDIGSTKICALVGRKDEYGKLEILGMGKAESHGVIRGVVTNIDKTVNAISEAIAEAEKQSGIDIRVVNVGIAGQHIESLTQHGNIIRGSNEDEITLEDVNRLTNEMYRTVTPPGKEIIHVMPQDYTIDGETGIKEPVGMSGVRLEADFNIITAQTSAIMNIEKCVKRCSLDIENLILEPIASSMAVLTEEEKEAGVVLVDIGGGTTDVAIFYEGIIRHTAVIPFAGHIITNDIKEGCKIQEKHAEKLKVKFGCANAEQVSAHEFVEISGLLGRPPKEVSVKNVALIIEARMREIIEQVFNEIIKSGYVNKLVGGIVITGGGSQLKGCPELFQLMTDLDARVGHPVEYLGRTKNETAKSPMFATTVGLVLAGFRALDDRYEKYVQSSSPKVAAKGKGERAYNGTDFFRKIIERTKRLLLDDDLDKKKDY
jgi:cell division protein FtsA